MEFPLCPPPRAAEALGCPLLSAARGGLVKSPMSLQALQQHYHPEVSKAASAINQALSVPEVSIAPLLEVTAFEVRAWGRASVERVEGRGDGVAVAAQCRLTVHPFLADL